MFFFISEKIQNFFKITKINIYSLRNIVIRFSTQKFKYIKLLTKYYHTNMVNKVILVIVNFNKIKPS